MNRHDIEAFEIDQLLDAVQFRYGYDLKHYARASLERRVWYRVRESGLQSIGELTHHVLHDEAYFSLLVNDISITATELFRDPNVFRQLRESVSQILRTYPRINVWLAGCATGEEAYSVAILLAEVGLLKRTRIYATDFNNAALEKARAGIYSADKLPQFTRNYLAAGGTGSLSDYYHAKFDAAKFDDSLRENITFANHNLMNDGKFADMHLVLCRNVMIYFDRTLQNRVLNVFTESLVHRGFLVLGDKESLHLSAVEGSFDTFDATHRIYRKSLDA